MRILPFQLELIHIILLTINSIYLPNNKSLDLLT